MEESLSFVLARKSVSTTRNEAFVEKYVSNIRKNCFFWQIKIENGFYYQESYFSLKIASP